jgi:hypothetical protein
MEDISAVSNALECQNSPTRFGESPVRNSAPVVQILKIEVLLRSA